jgi:cysteine desulfurase
MMPYLTDKYGNAASRNHAFGWEAEAAIKKAREQLSALIGATPNAVCFTSGATESNNLAIKGVAEMYRDRGNHLITCLSEHNAVIDPCKRLEKQGFEVTWLKPDQYGQVHPEQIAEAMTDKTILVSIMAANNEVGTINPVAEIGRLTRERGVFFHCDATQAVGKIPVNVDAMNIDLMSLSAHKFYGPKGVGALFVRQRDPRVRPACQIDGGGHERGLRSGTLNVTGIVGLGAAAELAMNEMDENAKRISTLRDRLQAGIEAGLDEITLNGHPTERLPNTLNISFAYVEGESLMMKMKIIAVSSSSACTSASLKPSHVLIAMGIPEEWAHNAIRFSLGKQNTEEEIDYTIKKVIESVHELRELSPLYELAKKGVDLNRIQWSH